MAHYAFLENNIVTEVIVGKDETELIDGLSPEAWYQEFRGQTCLRTSYSGKIRFNFAGIGYTYDAKDDAFIPPNPNCGHEELFVNENKTWSCTNGDHTNVLP
jgi:hypothetical protein